MKKEILQTISSNVGNIMKKSNKTTRTGGADQKKMPETIVDFITDSISGKNGGDQAGSQQGQGRGKGRGPGRGRGGCSSQGRGRGGR